MSLRDWKGSKKKHIIFPLKITSSNWQVFGDPPCWSIYTYDTLFEGNKEDVINPIFQEETGAEEGQIFHLSLWSEIVAEQWDPLPGG